MTWFTTTNFNAIRRFIVVFSACYIFPTLQHCVAKHRCCAHFFSEPEHCPTRTTQNYSHFQDSYYNCPSSLPKIYNQQTVPYCNGYCQILWSSINVPLTTQRGVVECSMILDQFGQEFLLQACYRGLMILCLFIRLGSIKEICFPISPNSHPQNCK